MLRGDGGRLNQIRVVARRELREYFDQPTAYVVGVGFLALALFLAFRSLYWSGLATLRPVFEWLPFLFAVFVPAVTMRSLAEERRQQTLEWLMAQPLTATRLVVGKFLGCWLFVLAILAGTIPTAIALLAISRADPGIVVSQYAGAALLAAQLVGIGLLSSSVARNQVTAFTSATLFSFVLVLMGMPVVQLGLPPRVAGVLAQLSVIAHFESIARGVIDLRDAIYFVSTTALFLTLAVAAVTRERLSRARAEYHRLRIAVLLLAANVLVLNILGSHIHGRLDLTRDRLFTLADGTRRIVGSLDDLVQVQLYVSRELPPEVQLQFRDVRDLLADMRRASRGKLSVTEVDPDLNEVAAAEAATLGIRPIEFNVVRANQIQTQRAYYGMAVTYADTRRVMPVIERTIDLEFRLASAIAGLTDRKKPGVSFLSGFGAVGPEDIRGLSQNLGNRITLRTLELARDTFALPGGLDSTQVLVVAGPTVTIDSVTIARIRTFVRAGGAALILVDPVVFDQGAPAPIPVRSGLEPLLEEWGVRFTGRLVLDLASHERFVLGRRDDVDVVVPYPLWPITVPAGVNTVVRGLSAITMGWAGALEIRDSTRVAPILQTSEAGALRDADRPITPDQEWTVSDEQLGIRTVAVAIDPGRAPQPDSSGRIIVVADASFIADQFTAANPQNVVFFANAIDWLTQDESLIRIRSKDRTPPPLLLTSSAGRYALKWGNLVGVPLLLALLGIYRVSRRRRRAEARWRRVSSD